MYEESVRGETQTYLDFDRRKRMSSSADFQIVHTRLHTYKEEVALGVRGGIVLSSV